MDAAFTTLDLVVFVGSLILVMAVALVAGRKEDTSLDYFLAGRGVRWFGVAGSIFASNVSANHLVGFVGAGFAIGFAQSHFELGAIAGLMALCYGFLPIYRKLGVYTLSEYLSLRYDDRSRIVYAVFMVVIMVVVQMVGGLYIGSRSMKVLLAGSPLELSYNAGVIALAAVAAAYTIQGGLKAVIWTDVIQSLMLLGAGIVIALLVFAQPEVGGWTGMMRQDIAAAEEAKMRLYLPSDHPSLPWSGVLTGLMTLHLFYWGTNQFIVQRALGARSDTEARRGIVAAGMLKLLIPFFSIAAGVAAFYMLRQRMPDAMPQQDAVFAELIRMLIVPYGAGLMGLIAAGLIGAILSSIDSMMNSAATIVTFDVYRRYINPQASERRLIWVGRGSIVVFVVLAATLAIVTQDPDSDENFFLRIVDQQSHLIPGLLVAFILGMFWRGATAAGAFVCVVAGPVLSLGVMFLYQHHLSEYEAIRGVLGEQLNMLHRVAAAVVLAGLVHVGVSLFTRRDQEKSKLVWAELVGGGEPAYRRRLVQLAASLAAFLVLAGLMVGGMVQPFTAALVAAAWTLGAFVRAAREAVAAEAVEAGPPTSTALAVLQNDRTWAGVLSAAAIFMMFYFYLPG